MKAYLKWLIVINCWSVVALVLGICNVSYAKYGKYWWVVALVLIFIFLYKLIRDE